MWSRYGDQERGLILKVSTIMFDGRNNPIVYENGGAKITNYLTLGRSATKSIKGPNKVCFIDNPTIESFNKLYNELVVFRSNDFGLFKLNSWASEKE